MKQLEFQDDGRTFICLAGTSPATPGTVWWWVSITGESQRYAAFRTRSDDTPASLKTRVLAYYTQLLVDRARPREIRAGWGKRRPDTSAGPAAGEAQNAG